MMDKYRYAFAKDSEWLYDYFTLEEIQAGCAQIKVDLLGDAGFVLVSRDQWTELMDKNKRDIYQNDNIVFNRFADKFKGTVVFCQGCFIVVWESVVGAYGEKATHSVYLKECEDVEIIGTTYDKEAQNRH